MCIHKDVESWTIHKFKVESNSDKITNLQHSSCTISNILEKSINHTSTRSVPDLYWRISQPIHISSFALSSYSCGFFPPWKKSLLCNSKFKMAVSRVDLLTSGLPRKNELTLRRGHQFQCRIRITAGTNILNKDFFCWQLLNFHFSLILKQHWFMCISFGLEIFLCTTKIRRTIEHCIASYPSCNPAKKDYIDVYFSISS